MTSLLIVEDNERMRTLIKTIVADLVEAITECDDGDKALCTYTECRPEWVSMDLRMKEVDGLTATRQVKAAFPEARIIIVTEFDKASLRAAAQSAGACAYVVKENLFQLRQLLAEEKQSTQEAL